MDRTLLIMAAGLGSRYGGNKQMDGVGPSGETVLEYSVYDAIKAGFNKVVFVIRPDFADAFKSQVTSKFEDRIKVEYAYQTLDNLPIGYKVPTERIKPLGTGHAVWTARDLINEPFIVINADDFYGRSSFEKVFKFYENCDENNSGNFCMVAYKLKNTLSDFGTVNRGECYVDENGFLSKVVERLEIKKTDENTASFHNNESGTMSLDTHVSMNFWGFSPDFFQYIDNGLHEFLSRNENELKAEYFLPSVVQSAIESSVAEVKVLETDNRWYGMTYPEDRQIVVNAIRQMVQDGVYPENLWN